MSDEPDFQAEGLLEGVDGEARNGRLGLLRRLWADGMTLDDLRRAVEEHRLVLLPVERALGGEKAWTRRQLAEEVGVDMGDVASAWRAFGLPNPDDDDQVFTDEDLELARILAAALSSGVDLEAITDLNRVIGRGMAQIAAAARFTVGSAFLHPGDREDELAERYEEATKVLLPAVGRLFERVFNLHLRELIRTDVLGTAEIEAGKVGNAREAAVAFADLVGFTRLGGRVPAEQLGEVTRRLEQSAQEVIPEGVRVVKTIGDAVLLTGSETQGVLEAALALVEAADARGDDFPQLRAGVAVGPLVERDGDLYGHPVNLASRITDLAKPGSVVVTGAVREQLEDDFRWSSVGRRKLKGVGNEKLFRARRPRADGTTDGDGDER